MPFLRKRFPEGIYFNRAPQNKDDEANIAKDIHYSFEPTLEELVPGYYNLTPKRNRNLGEFKLFINADGTARYITGEQSVSGERESVKGPPEEVILPIDATYIMIGAPCNEGYEVFDFICYQP